MERIMATAKKSFTAPLAAGVSLVTEREGAFSFTKASDVELHDGHVVAAQHQVPVTPTPVFAPAGTRSAPTVRVERARFDEDAALVKFINDKGWTNLGTQKILDSVRAEGHSASMARVNRLLNRDSKGNALPAAEPVKAEA
jgi:hypothetical protein